MPRISLHLLLAALALLHPGYARAEIPVSIELVLAVDTSLSVDEEEYDLQMTGIVEAFRHPEIIDLIGQQNGVAVTLFQWSNIPDQYYRVPWRLLSDRSSVLAFAAEVKALVRSPLHLFTGIGKAMEFGMRLIMGNNFAGQRLKIDISGDGRDNVGFVLAPARLRAASLGIAINGLPILVSTHGLEEYYRDNIIAGPGAFLETAKDYDDFARAFLRKLRREITPHISRNYHGPGSRIQGAAR